MSVSGAGRRWVRVGAGPGGRFGLDDLSSKGGWSDRRGTCWGGSTPDERNHYCSQGVTTPGRSGTVLESLGG